MQERANIRQKGLRLAVNGMKDLRVGMHVIYAGEAGDGCWFHESIFKDGDRPVYELLEVNESGGLVRARRLDGGESRILPGVGCCQCHDKHKNLLIIEKPQTTLMKTLTTTVKKLVDKDVQALLKAEYLDGDLELTEKGAKALLNKLFLENKSELADDAREEIAEAEKAEKK